jgi:NitT/TauT family transport system substrate-binding protein
MMSLFRIAAAALALFLLAPSAGAQPLTKIRIGYPSISSRQAQLWIAKDEGLFRKYGLDVELIFLRGGQVAVQALASGDPPLVTVGNVILANLQGYENVLVASVENSYDQIVFARPGAVNRVEQLKGRRFGISGFGTATHNAAVILFKKFNLDAAKDVALIATGPAPERLAAMQSGKVDATFFNPSEAPLAAKAGLVELIQMADLGVEVQGSGLATSRAFIRAHRDAVKAALKGYIEGIYFIFVNKAATEMSLTKYMRTNDSEVLEYSYRHYLKRTPKKPYPTMKGIQYMLDMAAPQFAQAKSARPEQCVDLSFLQELETEGFFADMEKRYR